MTPEALIARADKIDRRLGPIPGGEADAIARELRAAAGKQQTMIAALEEIVSITNGCTETTSLKGAQACDIARKALATT